MGCKDSISNALHSKCGVVTAALVTFCLSVYSIVSVVTAYDAIAARSADVSSLIDNWQTKPLVNATAVLANSSCPANFEPLAMPAWPGAIQGPCACPQGASFNSKSYSSSSGGCSDNQTKAGCVTDPALPKVPIPSWREGYKICFKRGAEASASWASGSYEPRPPLGFADGKWPRSPTCPAGYRQCGSGDYTTGAVCVKAGSLCPITALRVMTAAAYLAASSASSSLGAGAAGTTASSSNSSNSNSSSILPGGVGWNSSTPLGGTGYVLWVERGGAGRFPIVDTLAAFSGSDRGHCIQGKPQQWSGAGSDGKNSYPSACRVGDARYAHVIDTQPEKTLLGTAITDSPLCSPSNRATLAVPLAAARCSASDAICKRVTGRSVCTKALSYTLPGSGPSSASASSSSSSSTATATAGLEWSLLYRPEISWSHFCEQTKDSIRNANVPLQELLRMQNALMIVNIFANLVVGLIVPCLLVYNRLSASRNVPCIPGDGDAEAKFIDTCKGVIAFSFKAGKLVPCILAILVSGRVRGFFTLVSTARCSDATTNGTFDFIGSAVDAAYWGNLQAAAVDSLQLLLNIAQVLLFVAKKRKKGNQVHAEQNGGGGEGAEPVPAAALPVATQAVAVQQQQQPMMMQQQPMVMQQPGMQQPMMAQQPMMMQQQPMVMQQPMMMQQQPMVIQQPMMMQQQPMMMQQQPMMMQQQPMMMQQQPMMMQQQPMMMQQQPMMMQQQPMMMQQQPMR